MQSAAPGAVGSAEPAAPGAAECKFSLLGFFSLSLFFLTSEPAWARMDSGPGQGSAAVYLVWFDLVAEASELVRERMSSDSEQSFESEQGFVEGFSVCSELLMAAPWTAVASP